MCTLAAELAARQDELGDGTGHDRLGTPYYFKRRGAYTGVHPGTRKDQVIRAVTPYI